MKQPKKRWAWTARQHGRSRLYSSFSYQLYQPSRSSRERHWGQHRTQTRTALHQLWQGAEETEVQFPYQHKYSAHWDCT
ncbi:hypothetical protein [Hymenobacter cellulosivorans]|uniref:Uncharacterized protein n=1 Tax=Hymenobacter cellulosivorans TaxID=2932249 RepID=A0ABY4F438_9BACT|nr:hypothetical protein [Hymenobacter cellulosivorans]UOQ51414.1 hypothetical protein MUN80_16790 [Hymenobacter cellulosivorans]